MCHFLGFADAFYEIDNYIFSVQNFVKCHTSIAHLTFPTHADKQHALFRGGKEGEGGLALRLKKPLRWKQGTPHPAEERERGENKLFPLPKRENIRGGQHSK